MSKKSMRVLFAVVALTAAVSLSVVLAMGKKPSSEDSPEKKSVDEPTDMKAEVVAVPVEVLYRDQQCGLANAQARWLESAEGLDEMYHSLRANYAGSTERATPEVNWDQQGVLLVAMGQQRTGGYGLELAAHQAKLDNGVLQVKINWLEPQKGMMLIQVLTSPCLLLKTSKASFDRIEVQDQTGNVRFNVPR